MSALVRWARRLGVAALFSLAAGPAMAACNDLPNWQQLKSALQASVGPGLNGGFDLPMWATLVDRDGFVCAVAFSGGNRGAQWPGSRIISAQKANTANAFSLDGFALSTANLYTAVQPGGSLFGLQESNVVNPAVAYAGGPGDSHKYGQVEDPMVGGKIGGVNVFGGGLALYRDGKVVGGLGVSGDSSCADHNVAWRVRSALGLFDDSKAGPSPNGDDGIVYDIRFRGDRGDVSRSGWGHPTCGGTEPAIAVSIGAGYLPRR